MPTDRPEQRIQDILTNIASIEDYTADFLEDAFYENRMVVDAVERCMERMAETARKLGDRFDDAVPSDVNLQAIRQFGSVLRHDYDVVDATIIRNVVARELPKLKAAFQELQKTHPLPSKETDPDFDPFAP